jgi:diguanylate cyclase (GGDEF)-like protein
MITRTRLTTTVVLTAASLTAGTVAAAGLALGGGLRVAAPLGLGVSLAAAALGLVVTLRMVAGTTGRLAHLAAQYEAAHRDARTDPLTGLWNRRHFDERLAAAVARALRYAEPFSVAIFDLDDFKAVNDRYGHRAGDTALQHIAALLQAGTRESDLACRWGGEEFAVLFERTRPTDAVRVAERIARAMRATAIDLGGTDIRVTVSAGVSCFPSDGNDGPAVLEAADDALRRAKSLGKDRVERAWSPAIVVDLTDAARVRA